ncbi:MAG: radical SAM protein [Candidatus Omnitrophica bacterium]|nr:radical SAM protein [Candidatus Omnitrophota bacterium]
MKTTDHRLKEIIFSITDRCNLRCAMCQIGEGHGGGEMTTEQIKGVIRDALVFCPHSIIFSGGEPLLRRDIFELVAFVNRLKVNTVVTSNGTLIDDAAAGELSAAGIGVVNVSIDGPQEVHDALRGAGNFQKAVRALENLSRHKIETTVAVMVSRRNYAHLPDVMDLARRHGVTTVKFQPFSDIFLAQKERGVEFFAPGELRTQIRDSIEKVIGLSRTYRICTNPAGYLRAIPAYLCGRRVAPLNRACASLWTSCPVTARGDVYPCWVMSDITLGNIGKKNLSSIWGSEDHERLRRRLARQGCPGCLMSCYDGNFSGRFPGRASLRKFSRQRLAVFSRYKRWYYRAHQNLKYILRRGFGRLLSWRTALPGKTEGIAELRDEIRAARQMLLREMAAREVHRGCR